jgi:hypothetical protein
VTDARRRFRPFFPSARDFEAATRGHFQFLVDEFAFSGPLVIDRGESFGLRYDGPGTAVLLNWDVEGGYFACHLAPRLDNGEPHPDPDRWLSPNEVLAARGAAEDWVTHADLEGADEARFAETMSRYAANLRNHCADVLRGDWSIFDAAHSWLERPPDA